MIDVHTGSPIPLSKKSIATSFLIGLIASAVMLILLFSGMLSEIRFTSGTDAAPLAYIAFAFIVITLMLSVLVYMLFEQREYLQEPKYLIIIYIVIIITVFISALVAKFISPYMRPLFLAAFLTAVLLNGKLGLFVNFMTNVLILLARIVSIDTFTVSSPEAALMLTGLVTGTIAVLLTNKNRRRIEYLYIALFLSIVNMIFSTVTAFIDANAFSVSTIGTKEMVNIIGFSFASGFVNVFLFLGLLPAFETFFNIVTNFRLGELADVNRPLLMRLKTEAPGTFNHSLVLSNIAEACASEIGENTYMARAAAFYHDIGKLKNPQYFIENQLPGNNPHDDLSPEMSVSLIKKHIQGGVALAKEYKLPVEIIGIIKEHHGTLPIKFFYHKAQKYTDGLLDEAGFCYDGPKPQSKIAAIIMIADGAEAAIRAAQNAPDEVKAKIVDDIISERMNRNQFAECDITMSDLAKIKETILTTFAGVFHERIAYPTTSAEE